MIWKQVALPCLEAMTDQARKSSQICDSEMSVDVRLVIIGERGDACAYPEPALAVLGFDGVGVSEPVAEPSPESGGVVDSDGVDAVGKSVVIQKFEHRDNTPLDLKASPLERTDVVPQRRGSIGATEDVLVQVDAPDKVLVLPGLTETRELDVHGTVILEHVVALAEEGGELLDTNVLTHLELRDLVELLLGDVTVVHAQDVALFLGDAGGTESIGGVGGSLLGNGDSGDLRAVVETCEFGESSPAAANVKHGLAFFEGQLFAHDGHLVVLEFLESLFLVGVRDDSAGVDHSRSKEVGVMVVATVVVRADLLHILIASVKHHITGKSTEDEFHERPSQSEVSPVVAVFQDIENVALDVHFAIDVHLRKVLKRDFRPAAVLALQFLILESQVVFDRAVGQFRLVVDARAEAGGAGPNDNQNGEGEYNAKEPPGLVPAAEEVCQEDWDTDQAQQIVVAEAGITWTLCRKRGILQCCVL